MGVRGRNLPATMIEVRKDVVAATGGKQVPWDHSSLTGDFYFMPGAAVPTQGSIAAAPAGSSVDVAALQERLRKLEEAAQKKNVAALPVPPPLPPLPPVQPKAGTGQGAGSYQLEDNVRIDGLKIGEQRQPSPAACQQSCEQDASCVAFQHGKRSPVMGQCQLYARIDARQADASWRSGVRTGALLPAEATAARSQAGLPPLTVRAQLTRQERGFDIYDGVALMGDQIKMSATDLADGCKVVCRNTPGCRAATYNDFFRGKNVACVVYRDAGDVIKTPTSTLMVRTD